MSRPVLLAGQASGSNRASGQLGKGFVDLGAARHGVGAPLALLFDEYIVTSVAAGSPVKNGKELLARLKADPASLSIGIPGVGGGGHLGFALAAKAAGVPVSTIAYGTQTGTVELDGQTIPVPVDTETLATLARSTDGRAYTAESSDQLNQVYDDIQSTIGFRTEPREITQWFAGVALLLGLLAAGLSLRWFSRLP